MSLKSSNGLRRKRGQRPARPLVPAVAAVAAMPAMPALSACSPLSHGDARRATRRTRSGAVVQWCSDAAGVLDANRPAGQLGRRSSALGRFGSFTRHPLLVPNGIAARRPCHRDPCPRPDTPVDTTFPSLSARMYCGPPPSSPRRFSGLVVPGPPSLKYALHLGGITSQVDPAHGMLHK